MSIYCSVVVHKASAEEITNILKSLLPCNLIKKIFICDNSSSPEVHLPFCDGKRIIHLKSPGNIGYGPAHNQALKRAMEENAQYHIALNTDVSFMPAAIDALYNYMEENKDAGQIMPKICYNDGTLQRLCKLLPRPADLFGRRFENVSFLKKIINPNYELPTYQYDKVMNVPSLSGCFMFFRMETLRKAGFFDPRYFVYLEDVDITRRIHNIAKTVCYPFVSINHGYQKSSYADSRMFRTHIISAIKYFNKWGWFIDKERKEINRKTLEQLQ